MEFFDFHNMHIGMLFEAGRKTHNSHIFRTRSLVTEKNVKRIQVSYFKIIQYSFNNYTKCVICWLVAMHSLLVYNIKYISFVLKYSGYCCISHISPQQQKFIQIRTFIRYYYPRYKRTLAGGTFLYVI